MHIEYYTDEEDYITIGFSQYDNHVILTSLGPTADDVMDVVVDAMKGLGFADQSIRSALKDKAKDMKRVS